MQLRPALRPSPRTPARPRRAGGRAVRHVLCLVVVLLALGSGAAGAQETTTSTATAATPATASIPATVPATVGTVAGVDDDVDLTPNMIPEPNSGRAPRDAGERGGWMQEVLFFVVCAAVLFIGALVWRESRAKRRQQGRLT